MIPLSSDGRKTVNSGAVTQFAVLDALMGGMYTAGIPVSEVHSWGDTGIGCCDRLGGEVLLVDGEAFECTVDAAPRLLREDETLPFVDVCSFGQSEGEHLEGLDLGGLTAAVEDRLVSRNLFHAVRVDGVVRRVRTRVTARQEAPFRPLVDVAAEQVETVTHDRSGVIVGFWMPRIYQGISVAGLHVHFLSEDRLIGGHVLDVDIDRAVLRVSAFAQFSLRLPLDEEFLATELTHGEDHRITAIEGGAPGSRQND
ncbi:acetolactate decarboxylase [Microbacterium sp.]|uniref:acetolactate decarboxylase n=1 Tax=Microbacterium sp. TaxID=51671 RepID=UPI0025F52037|nr:acetolactate decarboxylase [Microbacterium sp.]MBT9605711.1 acetolactate decarboxylase [Microbacterium sp.]